MRVQLVLAVIAIAATAKSAAASKGPVPQYNGNCTGCIDAAHYYCAADNTCWSTDFECNTDCGFAVCKTRRSECDEPTPPPVPGILPQYKGHCAQCTAVAYYCSDSQLCYSDLTNCRYHCVLCYEAPSQCPGHSNNGTLPQYNGNCVACTGPEYYCPSSTLCFVSAAACGVGCGVPCYSLPAQCSAAPPTPSSYRLPQYDGDCIACTGPGYYCPTTTLCYALASPCTADCGGIECYVTPTQCTTSNSTLPQYNGNCSACTGASGAYCAGDNKCWKTDFDCNTDCGFEVCMTTQKQCAALPPATATPGILPNYNCVQCTNVGGGYCTDSGRCYSDMLHCQYHCVRCDSVPSQCSSTPKVARRL